MGLAISKLPIILRLFVLKLSGLSLILLSSTLYADSTESNNPQRPHLTTVRGAQDPSPSLEYTDAAWNFLPEADRFQLRHEGLILHGFRVGDAGGYPILISGGFTSNMPYLRLFSLELAARGFNVYVYNPPGQGAGEMTSGHPTNSRWNSFLGLVKAMELMIDAVYRDSNGMSDEFYEVAIAGHSLGGLVARAATLGINNHLSDRPGIDELSQERTRRKVSLIIPLLSPSILPMDVDSTSLKERFRIFLGKAALFHIAPLSLEYRRLQRSLLPNWLNEHNDWLMGLMTSLHSNNPFLNSMWGTSDILRSEIIEIAPLMMSDRIPQEIVKDLENVAKEGRFLLNGLDLTQAWREMQEGPNPYDYLYFVAGKDLLAPPEILKEEARATGGYLIEIPGGHIGPFFDAELSSKMSAYIDGYLINNGYKFSCLDLLTD